MNTVSQNKRTMNDRRLDQRRKQIDYYRNAPGYHEYLLAIKIVDRDINKSKGREPEHPVTPPLEATKYSKRAWAGLMKCSRRGLSKHWRPSDATEELDVSELELNDDDREEEDTKKVKLQFEKD
jgi:hypothetical protein